MRTSPRIRSPPWRVAIRADGWPVKLGIVIQHYDARNDVRELVELLAAKHDVVLFADERKLRDVLAPCEKRPFRQRLRPSDRFWLQAWNFFGELPASRNNFLGTELFKLASLSHARRAIASARLRLRMRLPSLMSFDFLLDRLVGSDMTPVDDIDRFLVITELSSPRFLSRALRAGKRVDAYVYSSGRRLQARHIFHARLPVAGVARRHRGRSS